MAQEQKPSTATKPPAEVKPASPVVYGIAAVLFLVAVVVSMLIITSNDVATTVAPTNLSAAAQAGKTVYLSSTANCNSCHPQEGRAGGIGPRLSTINDSDDQIHKYIRNGNGAMPANKQLTDDQINNIIIYLHALKPSA